MDTKIIEKMMYSNDFDDWTKLEKRNLLKIYFEFVKKEKQIYSIVWEQHLCPYWEESWEDIFVNYDRQEMKAKASCIYTSIDLLEDELETK